MKLAVMKSVIMSKTARQVLLAKKHSPVLLFGTGAVAMVGSTILACNATLKVGDLLDEAELTRAKVKEAKNIVDSGEISKTYTDKDVENDYRIIKVQTALKIAKLYVPAIGLGLAGAAALTGSHIILTNRNTAVMAAYAALDRGFKEYQQRVRDSFGDDVERKIRRAGEDVEYTNRETNEKVTYPVATLKGDYSIYARLWDATTSSSYQKQPEYNLAFLTAKQNYLNDRLKVRGHVLLNDAYDELGLNRTKEGCVVGWVKGNGDNYIDFGIFGGDGGAVLDFVTGVEGGIWLDFNVDGVVYDLI